MNWPIISELINLMILWISDKASMCRNYLCVCKHRAADTKSKMEADRLGVVEKAMDDSSLSALLATT